MQAIYIVRAVLFGLLVFLSFVTLGLAGNILSTVQPGFIPFVYVQLDVAVPVISLAVVLPVLIVDFFRKGAFTSMVAVEISWTFFLWVLWLAAAGQTTGERANVSCVDFDTFDTTQCHMAQGLIALTWIGSLIILGWHTTLFIYAFIAHSRGNTKVWTSSVTGTNFTVYVSPSTGYALQKSDSAQPSMPMLQQQQQQQYQAYPPQGYPPTGPSYNTAPPQQQYQAFPSQGYPPTDSSYGMALPPQQQHPSRPYGVSQV